MISLFSTQRASRTRARTVTTALRVLEAGLAFVALACESTDDGASSEPLETISSRDPRGSGLSDLVMGSDGERIGFAVGDSAERVGASEDAGREE